MFCDFHFWLAMIYRRTYVKWAQRAGNTMGEVKKSKFIFILSFINFKATDRPWAATRMTQPRAFKLMRERRHRHIYSSERVRLAFELGLRLLRRHGDGWQLEHERRQSDHRRGAPLSGSVSLNASGTKEMCTLPSRQVVRPIQGHAAHQRCALSRVRLIPYRDERI